MAGYYNKDELREQLEVENIYDLIVELGGEPEYTSFGLVSQTICHNEPGEGSRKLYYYENSGLFKCYTDCDDTFDAFELVIKAIKIQKHLDWELYDAMCYIAEFFGFAESARPEEQIQGLKDWELLKRYNYKNNEHYQNFQIREIKEINPIILTRFAYLRISDWEKEGISAEVCRKNFIGYYPGNEQITIPHFDINGKLIGIRGRTLIEDDAERYGKYRPLYINHILYNHPLSINLYNLNKSKQNIMKVKTAIIFESEKSCLMYQTIYGMDKDISVACCGSSVSNYQIELLESLGVKEVIIAFDRQFKEIGDEEFKRLTNKIINIKKKYGTKIKITAIFDKEMITPYKSSPIDQGREIFEHLLENRIKDF